MEVNDFEILLIDAQKLVFNVLVFKGPCPGKWHVFVLALLYLFECLNE